MQFICRAHVFAPGTLLVQARHEANHLVASYADLLPERLRYARIIRLNPPDYRQR